MSTWTVIRTTPLNDQLDHSSDNNPTNMSTSSFVARSTSTFESLTKRSRPKVGIDLVDQKDGFVASYTTGDKIEGEVTVTAEHDIQFDDINITFEGNVMWLPFYISQVQLFG